MKEPPHPMKIISVHAYGLGHDLNLKALEKSAVAKL